MTKLPGARALGTAKSGFKLRLAGIDDLAISEHSLEPEIV